MAPNPLGVPGDPVRHESPERAAEAGQPVAVQVRAVQDGVEEGFDVRPHPRRPVWPGPLDPLVAVAGRQRGVGQQHGPALGHEEPRAQAPRPHVVRGQRPTVDHDQHGGLRVGRHAVRHAQTALDGSVAVRQRTRHPDQVSGQPWRRFGQRERMELLVRLPGLQPHRSRRAVHRVPQGEQPLPVRGRTQLLVHRVRDQLYLRMSGGRIVGDDRASSAQISGHVERARIWCPGPLPRIQVAELETDHLSAGVTWVIRARR